MAVCAGAAAIVSVACEPVWAIPLWLLVAGMLVVFRETARKIPSAPLAVVSPMDGTVIAVSEVADEKVQRQALSIVIAVRAPGVQALRSPSEGKVMDLWTSAGPCDEPAHSPGKTGNRACYSVWVRTDEGDDVVCALSTCRIFSRFKSRVAPGERIGQGQRSGFVYFATRINVLLPVGSRCQVAVGDRLLAGSGILATLVHA